MASPLGAGLRRLAKLANWERRPRGGMRDLDHRPCAAVAGALGFSPARGPRIVHVAGSKGKGSVATLVAAGLERAGYGVGLVTSPHAFSVTERVRRGDGRGLREADATKLGAQISAAAAAVERARRVSPRSPLARATWFDAFTAAALATLRDCDAVVVECGLGGRRDSTNFLQADVAALTSVEVEHAEVLGATTYAIAREKAAIASPRGVLVVSGSLDAAARRGAAEVARRRGAAVVAAAPARAAPAVAAAAAAPFHGANLAVAAAVLDACGDRWRDGAVRGALLDDRRALKAAAAALPARGELLRGAVLVDGGHTAGAVAHVAARARRARRGRDAVLLVALPRDKDAAAFAAAVAAGGLEPRAAVACAVDGGFHSPRKLAALLGAAAPDLRVVACDGGPERALRRAKALATPPRPGGKATARRRGPRGRPEALVVALGSFKLARAAARALALYEKP